MYPWKVARRAAIQITKPLHIGVLHPDVLEHRSKLPGEVRANVRDLLAQTLTLGIDVVRRPVGNHH